MGSLKFGVHQQLEAAANELIRQSLKGVTSMAEKADILTPWKENDRKSREVYSPTGTADPTIRKGIYHRAWNSRDAHLNSRDGQVRGHRVPVGPASDSVESDKPWPNLPSQFESTESE